jgi:error-prone DNA polymerase
VQLWVELTRQLIGFPRHLSQHPGGFVIARDLLTRLVPVENAAMADRSVIQWDKDDLDALGLLKVDVLALGMLSAIRRALDFWAPSAAACWRCRTSRRRPGHLRHALPRPTAWAPSRSKAAAQMSMLPRLQPRCFYDLVIEVAIVRPGPIQGGMVHPYLRRAGRRAGTTPATRCARRWSARWACRSSRSR